ncbi:MAG: hypothetical protein WDZ61_00170 [Parcubacteria group bacterium]
MTNITCHMAIRPRDYVDGALLAALAIAHMSGRSVIVRAGDVWRKEVTPNTCLSQIECWIDEHQKECSSYGELDEDRLSCRKSDPLPATCPPIPRSIKDLEMLVGFFEPSLVAETLPQENHAMPVLSAA